MDDIRLLVDAGDTLGEGPVWDVAEQALYWVDIQRCLLRRRGHADGALRSWTLPERIGSFALRERGGAVCALASGLAFLDLETTVTAATVAPTNVAREPR